MSSPFDRWTGPSPAPCSTKCRGGCPPRGRRSTRTGRSMPSSAPVWKTAEDPRLLDAAVPPPSGYFDAVSLGAMYAMLAGRGQLGACASFPRRRYARSSRSRTIPAMTMQWRLGHPRPPLVHKQLPRAYGNFGFGAAGGFADPEHDLAPGCPTVAGLRPGTHVDRPATVPAPSGDLRTWPAAM